MPAALLVVSFVIAVLAVYRASRMLAHEDGPFTVFAWVRGKLGQKNWIGRGLHCPLCLGFWLAAGAAYLVGPTDWRTWLLLWLGIAGGQVLLWKYTLATGIESG